MVEEEELAAEAWVTLAGTIGQALGEIDISYSEVFKEKIGCKA